VQPALDRAAVDLALRQRDLGVRAHVADREHLALGADDRDRLVLQLDSKRLAVSKLRKSACPNVRG
jgi:hypothetical protein